MHHHAPDWKTPMYCELGNPASPKRKHRRGAPWWLPPATVALVFCGACPATAQAPSGTSARPVLEEVIVTASRREEYVQDVPLSIQVMTGAELERLGRDSFQDYLLTVPGVSFRDQGNGAKRVGLRGVSNLAGSDFGTVDSVSTVGLYLNDVPIQGTSVLPDLSLYDLNRVEILKGPQGTLYGEGAMGGAIRMILNQPNLRHFEGKAEAILSQIDAGGFGYQLRGMLDIPLAEDRFGIRLVASLRDDEGFVDNIAQTIDDINAADLHSLRIIALARPSDALSIELLALQESLDQDDFPQFVEGLGDLESNLLEDRSNETDLDLLGLTVKYAFPGVEATLISSYYAADRSFTDRFALGSPLINLVLTRFGLSPVLITQEPFPFTSDITAYTQELRLVSTGDQKVDWVLGAFYRDKENDAEGGLHLVDADVATINAALAAGGPAFAPFLLTSNVATNREALHTFEQIAIYGEANVEIAEGVELVLGMRWFDESVDLQDQQTGYGPLTVISAPAQSAKVSESGIIPKVGLAWFVTDDHLLYAQAAQGFRSGGPNLQFVLGVGEQAIDSDSLWNYEFGAKTRWLDGALIANASLYYVDWEGMQTNQFALSPVSGAMTGFLGNGGDARIVGGELNVLFAPDDRWRLGLNLGVNDSEVTKGVGGITEGEKLANLPEVTASAFAQYSFPVRNIGNAFFRFDFEHVDKQATRLVSMTSDGFFVDSYDVGGLRMGLESGSGRWGVDLFVRNLWDERAEVGRGLSSVSAVTSANVVTLLPPRTVGIALRTLF